jgi:serine/threonine protein kinase
VALPASTPAQRFDREIDVISRLHHPHLVPVRGSGIEDGVAYIAMDLIEGLPFNLWMDEVGHDPVRVCYALEQIARAVDYAHTAGAIHRDVKPGNIIVDDNDHAWLLDFGIALDLDKTQQLTITDEAVGTPIYMAPEQARNLRDEIGPRSDVWGIGVVLYEAVCAAPPFTAFDPILVLDAVCRDPLPNPRLKRPDLDRRLEWIMRRCLEKRPTDRYPTARALADDLERFRLGQTVSARPPSLVRRAQRWGQRHRATTSIIAVVVLATVVMGAWGAHEWHQRWAVGSPWPNCRTAPSAGRSSFSPATCAALKTRVSSILKAWPWARPPNST